MAAGDRVIIGDGSTWDDKVTVPVYEPIWEADGTLRLDNYNAGPIKLIGGVKGGSKGILKGQMIKVHRMALVGEKHENTSIGGVDLITMVLVFIETYQRDAWLPTHHIRIYSGSTNLDWQG